MNYDKCLITNFGNFSSYLGGGGKQRSRTPQGAAGLIKNGKLDAIPSSSSLTHPPKTDFTKYDLNSHKVAIVDDISRGQGSEEGRVSPSAQGEFVEVTSKKSQKERQRKEKEEQKRQEEERRRDENKKKRKQGGPPPRAGSAGSGSERTQHQSSSGSKPFSSWMMPTPITSEGESWEIDETLHSHLPVVSAAPGAQLKHPPPTVHPAIEHQAPPPPQASPQTTSIQSSQPQVSSSSSSSAMWPVDAPKPGVPHTAELVTSDYTLFGSGGVMLSHAVDSTLPLASAMTTNAPISTQQQASNASGGQKETVVSGEKKREGWQPQAKPNEQESPPQRSNDQEESSKSVQKPPRGRGSGGVAGASKNLPPRLKPQQQETSGPGRGRGARPSGRGLVERRGPGRDKSASSQETGGVVEKKGASANTAVAEQQPPADKEKVCTIIPVKRHFIVCDKSTCM